MRKPPRLEERLEAQRAARERTRTQIAKIRTQPDVTKARRPPPKRLEAQPAEPALVPPANAMPASTRPDATALPPKRQQRVHAGDAGLIYFDRIDSQSPLAPQPWTLRLTELALAAATDGSVVLALVWPARLDSIVPLHAFSSLERNLARELPGLRTLLYPGNHASRSGLNAWLIDRKPLAAVYRSLWTDTGTRLPPAKESPSMFAVLAALNTIETHCPEVLSPALGEVIPTFIFDRESRAWRATVAHPLERTLRKVPNQRYRTELRAAIGAEWTDVSLAPGALLIVHHEAKKDHWKAALQHRALIEDPPELFLYDATSAADLRNIRTVKRIPEFLKLTREGRYGETGSLTVTDDPKIFFLLRARLGELEIPFSVHVLAAEADETLLSSQALPANWTPEQKSNARISVAVVDRDACAVATNFHRLTPDTPGEPPPGYEHLLAAWRYLLRLSNLPAGYRDLTAAMAEGELDEYSSNQNAWATLEQAIRASLTAGCYGQKMSEVEKAIVRARKLVDAWAEATPMALKLQAAVRKHAIDSRDGLVVVLASQRYITLAHRFLARTLGHQWAQAEPRIEWHTLTTVAKNLSAASGRRHFVFVGVNRNVLRILLSHPNLPHGTDIFISYRQAESTLTTLGAMKTLPELKAYRGRIGLLMQELERRLHEVPNLQSAERLGELSLTFSFDEKGGVDPATEQSYYRFDLDGGGRAFRSGFVFKYEPDEDPVFRRTPAAEIEVGDFIFDMSERLRGKVEAVLEINRDGMNSTLHPERVLLRLYHKDVERRCAALFTAPTRAALAREIHAKMVALDGSAEECRLERVAYWLNLEEEDTRPHASRDAKFFRVFCRALEFSDEDALKNWNYVKNARRFNQNFGRALAAQYAEIIFRPESAITYRQIPADLVRQLQQEALHCVFRVERIEPPANKEE